MTKRIAVRTSGGAAPGSNAAIRDVVRTRIHKSWQVCGIRHGFAGLIAGHVVQQKACDVSGVIQQGGTVPGSARSSERRTEAGRGKAVATPAQHQLNALIVIGGYGS